MPEPNDGVYTVFEAAQFLGCSLTTVRRKIRSGELPGRAAWAHPRAPILLRRIDVVRYAHERTKAPQ